jgi:glucose-1-phosphate cytidylyltransferase
MKCIILAGGLGTRISEETQAKPKPMIEIGGKPIIWHIMKIYSAHGINDFVVACGYKGYLLKEYFSNYHTHNSDIKVNLKNNKVTVKKNNSEPWNVTLINTGENTMTGGRILRLKNHLKNEEDFCLTYGDGLADINIKELLQFHKKEKKIATVTAVKPKGRYGMLDINKDGTILNFDEKPDGDQSWINGGFFVLNKAIFKFLNKDNDIWEQGPLQKIAKERELKAFIHKGFWKAMDTLNDKNYLENLWLNKNCPWKIW